MRNLNQKPRARGSTRKTVKLTIGLGQAKRIHAHAGNGYGDGISDDIRKQIVNKVKKAFPEIAEGERQREKAWEILKRVHESPAAVSIRAECGPGMAEVQKSLEGLRSTESELYQRLRALELAQDERLNVLVNPELESAGISFFKAMGNRLLIVGGEETL